VVGIGAIGDIGRCICKSLYGRRCLLPVVDTRVALLYLVHRGKQRGPSERRNDGEYGTPLCHPGAAGNKTSRSKHIYTMPAVSLFPQQDTEYRWQWCSHPTRPDQTPCRCPPCEREWRLAGCRGDSRPMLLGGPAEQGHIRPPGQKRQIQCSSFQNVYFSL